MVNIFFRDNAINGTESEKKPKELYDIVLMDYITIRITIISGLKGIEYYSVDSIHIVNTNTKESDNQIKLKEFKKLFEKIIELCKEEYDVDIKLSSNFYILRCDNCINFIKDKSLCSIHNIEKNGKKDTCQDYPIGKRLFNLDILRDSRE